MDGDPLGPVRPRATDSHALGDDASSLGCAVNLRCVALPSPPLPTSHLMVIFVFRITLLIEDFVVAMATTLAFKRRKF